MPDSVILLALVVGIPMVFLFLRLREAQAQIAELLERLRAVENRLRGMPAPVIQAKVPTPIVPVGNELGPIPPIQKADSGVVTPPPLPTTASASVSFGAPLREGAERFAASNAAMSRPPRDSPPGDLRDAPAPPPSVTDPLRHEGPAGIHASPVSTGAAGAVPPPVSKSQERPSAISLEAFMGVKLFAWVGGLALFLGIAFAIKYSFEHNLITPLMRVLLGLLTGLGLVAGGWFTPRQKYEVLGQTLCATGIVTLYGVIFGAHALYGFFGLTTAFILMAGITAAAFLLAVGRNAQVVAILGLLGGFLTPILLSTGEDHALALFSYIALLDAGLAAVALRKRWRHLVAFAAVATVLMQGGWSFSFFESSKVFTAGWIFLGFEALFLLPFWFSNSEETEEVWTIAASSFMGASALSLCGMLFTYPDLGQKPWIVLSFALLGDAGLVVLPLRRGALNVIPAAGGLVVFLLLGAWNVSYLSTHLLPWALGYFVAFAAFHTAIPIVLRRFSSGVESPRWAQIFQSLSLVLMLWPALRIGSSTLLWGAVLLVDLAAIALAAYTASMLGVVAALVLTLFAAGLWLAQMPAETPDLAGLLTVIGGFAALFCVASAFLQRRLASRGDTDKKGDYEHEALQFLPPVSAVLPFVLLISVVERLNLPNPSPVFGVGLLLIVMLLALARWSENAALPLVGLGCGWLLEFAWILKHSSDYTGWSAVAWPLAFTAVFSVFPFCFQSRKSAAITPWATAALAAPLHYGWISEGVRTFSSEFWSAFWEMAPGLVPAALAIPLLACMEYHRRTFPRENPARLAVLAWYGGAALFFITLIFPAQFEREWLTISWALEGAALLWLWHRIPHQGLKITGFCLLCVVFIRLTLNSAVLGYHPRSGVPIANWYLYTYGIPAAALFIGGRLVSPPRHRLWSMNIAAVLCTLGTILTFTLLNIEVADFFASGSTLTFDFTGSLARDMTYSIAWSLYAFVMLFIGMARHVAAIRYGGIALLVVTLLKLFLHDLASLDQLYRIGAFIAVAIVLMGASYLYQRFLGGGKKAEAP